ncbi:MAG: tail fiber domain-containing protein [Nanoarchaeota archaeon]
MKKCLSLTRLFFIILIIVISCSSALADSQLLADQGSGVRIRSTGIALSNGSLSVLVYDSAQDGNLIYNETFASAISSGTWDITLGANDSIPLVLEAGKTYYKDYTINDEDVNFSSPIGDNIDRRPFTAPIGLINGSRILNGTTDGRAISNNTNISVASITAGIGGMLSLGPLLIQPSSGNSSIAAFFDGFVGIGDPSPDEKLVVSSGSILVKNASASLLKSVNSSFGGSSIDGDNSVFVTGTTAFVTAINDNTLMAFDITDKSNPHLIGLAREGIESSNMSNPSDIFVSGGYAFLTSNYDNSLVVFDVSDPARITQVGVLIDGVGATNLAGATSVFVSGRFAYVTSQEDSALTIIDVSNPSSPTEVGVLVDNVNATYLNGATDVFVRGNYAFVTSGVDNALSIYNISNPYAPVETGVIVHSIGATSLEGPSHLAVDGNLAYVTSLDSDSLTIINISDIRNPTEISVLVDIVRFAGASSVAILGKYALIASSGSTGLAIVDVSDPANPVLIDTVEETNAGLLGPVDVFVSGKNAFVASRDASSLSVFELSGIDVPSARFGPVSIASLDVGGSVIVNNDLSAQSVSAAKDVLAGGALVSRGNGDNVSGIFMGKVGIGMNAPTVSLDIDGDIEYTGILTDVSDSRLKDKISGISNPLGILSGINGVTYFMKGSDKEEAGVIAQDVQKVLPQAVKDVGNGYLGVSYQMLIPVLIEAVKEQQSQLESQSLELEALKMRICKLEGRDEDCAS